LVSALIANCVMAGGSQARRAATVPLPTLIGAIATSEQIRS
jgi:hypothetical protein